MIQSPPVLLRLLGALPWSGNPTGAHPQTVGEPDERAPLRGLTFLVRVGGLRITSGDFQSLGCSYPELTRS